MACNELPFMTLSDFEDCAFYNLFFLTVVRFIHILIPNFNLTSWWIKRRHRILKVSSQTWTISDTSPNKNPSVCGTFKVSFRHRLSMKFGNIQIMSPFNVHIDHVR